MMFLGIILTSTVMGVCMIQPDTHGHVTIPTIPNVYDSAFGGCTSLVTVAVGDPVTSIGNSAFSWCLNLSLVSISNSVTIIGSAAFSNCRRLSSVRIPD